MKNNSIVKREMKDAGKYFKMAYLITGIFIYSSFAQAVTHYTSGGKLAWTGPTVHVYSGASGTAIQNAINTTQENEGTVHFHAGTYNISSLAINNPVRLLGEGHTATTINITGTITVTYSYGEIFECTGLRFVGNGNNICWDIDTGTICFKNNYFQKFGRYGFMSSEGGILDGVISNCTIDRCSSGGYACMLYRGPNSQSNFDTETVSQSSAITAAIGAHTTLTNALFFEDCKFYLENGYAPIGGAGGGSRIVYRRNEFYQYGNVDKILDAHGDQSWSNVGTRLVVCYNNLFDATATNNDWQQGLHLRGGTAIVEDNRFVNVQTCATLATIEPGSDNPSTYLRAFFHGNTWNGSPNDAGGEGIKEGYDGGGYTHGHAPEAPDGIKYVLPVPHPLLADVSSDAGHLLDEDVSVYAYPSPVTTILTFNGENNPGTMSQIEFYKSTGQKVSYIQNVTFPCRVDVSSFKPGVHFIRILNGNKCDTEKVIKK
ncbi:MAG: T9SS type A sorting domain-containing protein [Prolixibacteraceae bacterium]|jgi:hypothetical protein|nr:T9SS type A sorting domain-containing protein [Prolixibacteraceae bacterium]